MSLADASLEDHPDEALAILAALRDAGCRACLHALTDYVATAAGRTPDQTVREKLERLANDAHGPPTGVTAAAEAVWKAFAHGDWRQLAPYVGPMTRVDTEISLADPPVHSTKHLATGALRAWFKQQGLFDLHRGKTWFCDADCCEYWSWSPSRGDVEVWLTRMCIATTGARPTLTRLDWGQ